MADDLEQRLNAMSYDQLLGYLKKLGIKLPRGIELDRDELIDLIMDRVDRSVSHGA